MQVLLLKSVPSLGSPGDLVSVKPGFARNYLVPQGKALVATTQNVKQFEAQKRIAEARRVEYVALMRSLGDKISKTKLQFTMKAGPTGKLFGSVTSKMIADALNVEVEAEIGKAQIVLDKPIRESGDYVLEVKLHDEVNGRVKVHVAAELSDEEPEEEQEAAEGDLAEDEGEEV